MLSSDHPHARLFERIYGPTTQGRGPALLESAIIEPFVAHTAGHAPIGGTFIGLNAFMGHIGLLRRLSGGTMSRSKIEFSADDSWAVIPQVITATRMGRSLEMKVAGFWRFAGPGQLVEHWEAVSNEAEWDEFWSAA